MTSEFTIAVHALVFLNHKATVYSSEGLAENVCTNPARIRKVMAKLKKADLVKTKEGVDGGYLFHRDSREINLTMVAGCPGNPLCDRFMEKRESTYELPDLFRYGRSDGWAL